VLAPVGLILVLLWSFFGHCDPEMLLAATGLLVAAIVYRLWDLRSGGRNKHIPLRLSLVAFVLPRTAAVLFLEEYGAICRDLGHARVLKPKGVFLTVAVTWQGWLRAQLLRVFLPALRVRLVQAETVLERTRPLVVCDSAELDTVRRCWRQLRWVCVALVGLTGSWQYQTLGGQARKLGNWCADLERRVASQSASSADERGMLEAQALRVRRLAREVNQAMAAWSPYTSDDTA
jgi:hypothetical protein